ncbi:hypothetical protein [Demequina aestuarii]|uniref:hypothetical protein n=1 Tax=Demequina aestuarii TaxID=327095 RepID=UPI000784856A|nr:hypothetical protein [Demequina aestuarii]
MTDESRPLSRRERREQELRDAARPADDTDALLGAPISESIPTHSPEGRMLTRRERRRLERARQPIETWTAEEEMIATGQIPAMTPERIAEQERVERERAEAAQREAESLAAEAASESGAVDSHQGEAPAVEQPEPEPAAPASWHTHADEEPETVRDGAASTDHDVDVSAPSAEDGSHDAPAVEENSQEPESSPEQPVEPEPSTEPERPTAPQRTSLIPASPDAGHPDPALHKPSPAHAVSAPQSEPESGVDWAPETDESPAHVDSVPEDEASDHDDAPHEEPTPPAPPSVLGMPPGMSPEMFAALFPPGSLQRRLMEQQATDQAEPAVEEPDVEDPAEEIRRLTQQAVAGIDAASSRRSVSTPADADPVAQSAAESAAHAVLPHAWGPAASDAQPPRDADSDSTSDTAPSSPSAPQAAFPDAAQPWAGSAPSAPTAWGSPASDGDPHAPSRADDEPSQQAPVSLDEAPFDAIIGHHPGTAALDEASTASVEMHRPAFHSVSAQPQYGAAERVPDASAQLAPHYAAFDVPQGSVQAPDQAESPWAAHPLMSVQRAAPELPEVRPSQNIPQPDLSSVRRPTFEPQSGGMPSIEPVPTGQIEVPPRERPDLEADGGPRHFKWAHLAVFGAVAFLLGVVVWNVAVKP